LSAGVYLLSSPGARPAPTWDCIIALMETTNTQAKAEVIAKTCEFLADVEKKLAAGEITVSQAELQRNVALLVLSRA